ncbi:hypothetical protein ACO2Q9_09825 [Variovorax sp. VNK109]|uniref:hypothetical protein n=1 Tax=Variovorax sp. VNK109 TaxID=3400919 RepID=UPI003C0ECDE0
MNFCSSIGDAIRRASRVTITLVATLLTAIALPAFAAGDHGEAPAASSAPSSPRFNTHSDLFELVGVVEGEKLVLFLDRFSSNEPVTNAKIDFEVGASKGTATAQEDGTYAVQLPALKNPGELDFSFVIDAGGETDLLAAHLEIGEVHDDHDEAAAPAWRKWLVYGVPAAFAALVLFFVASRRKSDSAQPQA